MSGSNDIITYPKGKTLYKTVNYECSEITSYMKGLSDQPCRTNKML